MHDFDGVSAHRMKLEVKREGGLSPIEWERKHLGRSPL